MDDVVGEDEAEIPGWSRISLFGVGCPHQGAADGNGGSPDHSMATTGPEVMKSSSSGKNGFSTCSS